VEQFRKITLFRSTPESKNLNPIFQSGPTRISHLYPEDVPEIWHIPFERSLLLGVIFRAAAPFLTDVLIDIFLETEMGTSNLAFKRC
jgi:hypothetical protein